ALPDRGAAGRDEARRRRRLPAGAGRRRRPAAAAAFGYQGVAAGRDAGCTARLPARGLTRRNLLTERQPRLVAVPQRLDRRADERLEEGVRPGRPRLELRVELAPEHERVVRELHDLDQLSVRRRPADAHPGPGQAIAV